MVVLCEWCHVCYIGNDKYLGKGIGELKDVNVIVNVVDGNCLLCKNEEFPINRRYKYKTKEIRRK